MAWHAVFHGRVKEGIQLVSSQLLFCTATVHSEGLNCSRLSGYLIQPLWQPIRNSDPSPESKSDGGSSGQAAGWPSCKAAAKEKDPAFPRQLNSQSLVADSSGRWIVPRQSGEVTRCVSDNLKKLVFIQKFYWTRKKYLL